MTKDELNLKLSEVAEFRMPKLTASDIKISKQKARGKGRPTKEWLYQEEHEEVFIDMFQGINPTHNPELVKVKIQAIDCEDCGDECGGSGENRSPECRDYGQHSGYSRRARDGHHRRGDGYA